MPKEKKQLSTSQRNMLDKIYSERFRVVESRKRDARSDKRDILRKDIIKDETKKVKISSFIKKFNSLEREYKKLTKELIENGLRFNNTNLDSSYELYISVDNGYNCNENKKIVKFDEETIKDEEKLSRVKTEMRAKIHGLDISYEDIESEIEKAIKLIA